VAYVINVISKIYISANSRKIAEKGKF